MYHYYVVEGRGKLCLYQATARMELVHANQGLERPADHRQQAPQHHHTSQSSSETGLVSNSGNKTVQIVTDSGLIQFNPNQIPTALERLPRQSTLPDQRTIN
jgi:hypothetical protein